MAFDAIVIGAVGIDTNVYLYTDEPDFNVEMNFSQNIDTIGQAGGYSARLLNRLGYNTAFIGFVGNDYHGNYIKNSFQKDGINIDAVFIDPEGTRRSINFMYKNGRRRNFYDGKGNMSVHPDLIKCRKVWKGARLAHFSIENWTRELLEQAKADSLLISSDLQDIIEMDDDYRADYIKYSDIIFYSAANIANPRDWIHEWGRRFPDKSFICGMGSEGCLCSINGETQHFPTVALKEPVVDTNGAGDSLAIGFLTSYFLEKRPLEESVKRAQICARHTCTLKGNSENVIDRVILEKLAISF